MATTYRVIGKGTTDSNGVAHMDYSTSDGGSTWTDISSNPGYTGTGKGLVDIIGALDNPHVEGTIVSEPCNVWDTILYDNAIDGDSNNCWQDNNSIISRGATGTTLNGTTWQQIVLKQNNSTDIPFSNGICIELDVVAITGGLRLLFDDGTAKQHAFSSQSHIGHWKFTIKDGELHSIFNDGTPTKIGDFNTSVNTFKFQMQCYTNYETFTFKNFKMYSI